MKFTASQAAIARKAGVEPLKALANWTTVRDRYRKPSRNEACKVGIGIRFTHDALVVRDDGLLFVKDGGAVSVFTLNELMIE